MVSNQLILTLISISISTLKLTHAHHLSTTTATALTPNTTAPASNAVFPLPAPMPFVTPKMAVPMPTAGAPQPERASGDVVYAPPKWTKIPIPAPMPFVTGKSAVPMPTLGAAEPERMSGDSIFPRAVFPTATGTATLIVNEGAETSFPLPAPMPFVTPKMVIPARPSDAAPLTRAAGDVVYKAYETKACTTTMHSMVPHNVIDGTFTKYQYTSTATMTVSCKGCQLEVETVHLGPGPVQKTPTVVTLPTLVVTKTVCG